MLLYIDPPQLYLTICHISRGSVGTAIAHAHGGLILQSLEKYGGI